MLAAPLSDARHFALGPLREMNLRAGLPGDHRRSSEISDHQLVHVLPDCSSATPVDVRTYVRHLTWVKRTATDLRAHLYEVLDHVAKTGQPVEVVRQGVELCIVRKDRAERPQKRRTPRRLPDLIVGDPDELIHIEWPWSRGEGL